jgi:hypothetical protein
MHICNEPLTQLTDSTTDSTTDSPFTDSTTGHHSLARRITHSTRPLDHSTTHWLNDCHSLDHSLTHSTTRSLTQPLTPLLKMSTCTPGSLRLARPSNRPLLPCQHAFRRRLPLVQLTSRLRCCAHRVADEMPSVRRAPKRDRMSNVVIVSTAATAAFGWAVCRVGRRGRSSAGQQRWVGWRDTRSRVWPSGSDRRGHWPTAV